METIITGLIVAVLTGMPVLAYKAPVMYRNLMPILSTISSMAAISIVSIWAGYQNGVADSLGGKENSPPISLWYGLFSLMAFLYFMSLSNIRKLNKPEEEEESQKKPQPEKEPQPRMGVNQSSETTD